MATKKEIYCKECEEFLKECDCGKDRRKSCGKCCIYDDCDCGYEVCDSCHLLKEECKCEEDEEDKYCSVCDMLPKNCICDNEEDDDEVTCDSCYEPEDDCTCDDDDDYEEEDEYDDGDSSVYCDDCHNYNDNCSCVRCVDCAYEYDIETHPRCPGCMSQISIDIEPNSIKKETKKMKRTMKKSVTRAAEMAAGSAISDQVCDALTKALKKAGYSPKSLETPFAKQAIKLAAPLIARELAPKFVPGDKGEIIGRYSEAAFELEMANLLKSVLAPLVILFKDISVSAAEMIPSEEIIVEENKTKTSKRKK